MNSWLPSSVHTSSQPPPPGRREYAAQPPPLTTALSAHQLQGRGVAASAGYASTPLSTTPLSSSFVHGSSPWVPSPGSAMASSPMASRQPSYNVPYNPRDWGPVSGGQSTHPQSNNGLLRPVPHPPQPGPYSDDSLASPPPPYSPPSRQQQSRDSVAQNAANINSGAPTSTPSSYSGATEATAETSSAYRRMAPRARARPSSMIHLDTAESNRRVSLPPPPPLPHEASYQRASSHSRADAYREPRDPSSFDTSSRPAIAVSQEGPRLPLPGNQDHMATAPPPPDGLSRPPTSRRAVSAGPTVSSAGSSRPPSQSRSKSPRGGWEPGMPLPPPPPGPPPTTRSQSIGGLSEAPSARNAQTQGRTRTRPPPVLGTGLDSIPPTPAGWVDEANADSRQRGNKAPLTIDTSESSLSRGDNDSQPNDPSHASQKHEGNSGLFRSPAIRDPSAKGIRERRIERRNRQSQNFEDFSAVSTATNPWADALDQVKPSNLVLADSNNGDSGNVHQQPSSRITPRSGQSLGSDGQLASRSRAPSAGLFSNGSSYSTPRPEPTPPGPAREYAQTPPFSANGSPSPAVAKVSSHAVPPKALPTPPLQSAQDTKPSSAPASKRSRPVSHILHLPNESVPPVQPLSPRRGHTEQTSLVSVVSQGADFAQDAIQRYITLIEKEAGAANETEALKAFSDFIISESQVRRARYSKAWETRAFDVEDVRRKLFEVPQKTAADSRSSSPRRLSREVTIPDIPQSRPESAWWNNYKPCLSPIASLSMSNDEMSSRGRAPSRWWESNTGSSSEGGERRIQRSRRESKYMGLPLETIQGEEVQTPFGNEATGQHANYGPDEYPPEKVGWHDGDSSAHPSAMGHTAFESFYEIQKMDVSRLVTLPPPYPRHHPAVNNSHPDLVAYRTTVRSISDLSEIKVTRQRHDSEMDRLTQEHQERIQESHRQFKSNIQSQILEGSITFAEAAEAEAALIVEDKQLERELAKQGLDSYQENVLKPMRAVLTERILKATTCIDELSSKLFDDAQRETPDQTQGEGDEKPELLEKLTQLKWLFEAREQLHREIYDLVSDRDEKYKAVVLLPYKQNANEDKVAETSAFFIKDGQDRRVQHEADALARLGPFLYVVEENVVRGVEVQLSAFWDIAPSLLELVQKIPGELEGFQIQIPPNEYNENPSYRRHPLQYLHSLLSHAERSSYQYIESQINLLCLLHEVKSAVMRANCKLMEAERIRQGEAADGVGRQMQASRADEERALITDLKDRVATVEGQWTEALGSQIQGLRERIKAQLMGENGWEGLEELEQT